MLFMWSDQIILDNNFRSIFNHRLIVKIDVDVLIFYCYFGLIFRHSELKSPADS